jgi:hypothetical protein
MTDGSITTGPEKGSQEAEEGQEEVARPSVANRKTESTSRQV